MQVISRREALRSAGQATAFFTLVAALPRCFAAAATGDAAICLSMNYSNAPNASFDAAHYREKHLPMLRGIYGDTVERIELRVPRASTMPGAPGAGGPPKAERSAPTPGSAKAASKMPAMPSPPPSPLLAAISLWIRDVKGFAEKTAAARGQIADDLAQVVTGSQPVVQYDRVLALLGDGRDSVSVDDEVTSYYFINTESGKFDPKDYNDNVIPAMVKIYGEKALRRIEFTLGAKAEAGGQPVVAAAAHYYSRDRAAWDQASMSAGQQLAAEAAKHPEVKRVRASMRIAAAG